MSTKDDGCSGELRFSTADFDVISTSGTEYLKGSPSSWEKFPGLGKAQGSAAARMLDNKWLRLAQGETPLAASPLCRLAHEWLTEDEAAAVADGKVPSNLTVTTEGLTEVVGIKTVKLKVEDKKSSSDVWVSLEEPHHVIKMVSKSEEGEATVVFSDFDFPARIDVPKPKEVLDLRDVRRGTA